LIEQQNRWAAEGYSEARLSAIRKSCVTHLRDDRNSAALELLEQAVSNADGDDVQLLQTHLDLMQDSGSDSDSDSDSDSGSEYNSAGSGDAEAIGDVLEHAWDLFADGKIDVLRKLLLESFPDRDLLNRALLENRILSVVET